MQVFLVVRRLTADSFYKNRWRRCGADPLRAAPLRAWHYAFKTPWLTYRNHLRRIAFPAGLMCAADGIFNHLEVPLLRKIMRQPGCLLVPIDDDDWIDPQLFTTLRSLWLRKYVRGVSWPTLWYNQRRDETWEWRPDQPAGGVCMPSCAYALQTPCDLEELTWHTKAQAYLEAGEQIKLAERSAVYLAHIGSQSAWLQEAMSVPTPALAERIQQAARNVPSTESLPPAFTRQCLQFVNTMQALKQAYKPLGPTFVSSAPVRTLRHAAP